MKDKRPILFALLMVLPVTMAFVMGLTTDKISPEDNYSSFSTLDVARMEDGAVVYWADYKNDFSEIALQRLDRKGNKIGERMTLSQEGYDLYSPRVAEVGGMVYLTYLKVGGDLAEARMSEVQDCSMMVRSFDTNLRPAGNFDEAYEITRIRSRTRWSPLNLVNGSLYVEFDLDESGSEMEENGNISCYRLIPEQTPSIEKVESLKGDKALLEIKDTGDHHLFLVDQGPLSVKAVIPYDSEGPLFLVNNDSDDINRTYLLSGNGSVLNMWNLELNLPDIKHIECRAGFIHIFSDRPVLISLSLNQTSYTLRELGLEFDESRLREVAVNSQGLTTAAWMIDITVGSGDDEEQESYIRFVVFSNGTEIEKEFSTEYGWVAVRFQHVDNETLVGVFIKDSLNSEYTSFSLREERIDVNEVVATPPQLSFIPLIAMIVLPFAVGVPLLIISSKGQRLKQYRKMNETKLQLMDTEKLRKALGKKGVGKSKEELIQEILRPVEIDYTKEERSALYPYIPLKFVYFSILILIVPMIIFFANELSTPYPAYRGGIGVVTETLVLTILLSTAFSLTVKDWGTSSLRNASLITMGSALAAGEFTTLLVILLVIDPVVRFHLVIDFWMNIVPGILMVGLAVPFLMLYSRFRKKYLLLTMILPIIPIFASLYITANAYYTMDMLPVPNYISIIMNVFHGIGKLMLYLFIGLVCGTTMTGAITLNDIKPYSMWTSNDLDRARQMHFAISVSASALLSIGVLFTGLQTGLLIPGAVAFLAVSGVAFLLILIGFAMNYGSLVGFKNKDSIKQMSGNLMKVFFSPLLTLMGGFLLAMSMGIIGSLFGIVLTFGQLIYSNFKLKDYLSDLIIEVGKEPEEKRKVKKDSRSPKSNRIFLRKKAFAKRVKQNMNSSVIVAIVFAVITLLMNLFVTQFLGLDIFKGMVVDWLLLVVFFLINVPLLYIYFRKIKKTKDVTSPAELYNLTKDDPQMITGIVTLLFMASMVGNPLVLLLAFTLFIVPYYLLHKSMQDAVMRKFESMPKEERMILPGEYMIFAVADGKKLDLSLLNESREVISRKMGSKETKKRAGKTKKGKEKDEKTPERDENGQIVRGRLLYREPGRSLAKRRKTMMLVGSIAVIIGVMGLVYSIYTFLDPGVCGVFFGIITTVFSMIAIFLSFVMFFGKGARIGVEFYEGGAVDHSVLGGGDIYIPYGNFNNYNKVRKSGLGSVYILSGSNKEKVWLWPGKDEAKGHLKTILDRVGKPQWRGEVENRTRDSLGATVMPYARAIITTLGVVIAGTIMLVVEFFSWKISLLMIPAMIILFNMLFLFNPGGLSGKQKRSEIFKEKEKALSLRLTMVTVSLGLLLAVVFPVITFSMPGAFMPDDIEMADIPEEGVDATEIDYTDVNEVMLVGEGDSLNISSLNLSFSESSEILDLFVDRGGSLKAEDVGFRSRSGRGLSIEIFDDSEFHGCVFRDIWGDPGTTNGDGGVEVHGGECKFEGCVFINGTTNLVMVTGGSAVFKNCTFIGAGDDAVEVQSAEVKMIDCTVKDCEWGVMCFDGSDVEMEGCDFEGLSEGIVVSWSALRIRDCSFNNISGTAIKSDLGGDLDESGNVFNNVGAEISSTLGPDLVFGGFCMVIPVISGIVAVVILLVKYKRDGKKDG